MFECVNCLHFDKVSDKHGKCRSVPPNAALIPAQGIGGAGLSVVTYWPEVKPDDWCGSWKPSGSDVEIIEQPSTILKPN